MYLANFKADKRVLEHLNKFSNDTAYGEWLPVSGPDPECLTCRGEGQLDNHHNGDTFNCLCMKEVWVTNKEKLDAVYRKRKP